MNRIFRVHDLLRLEASQLQQAIVPENSTDRSAMDECLRRSPFVVVRRASFKETLIPVGIRGRERSQRIAGWCDPEGIAEVISPESLRNSSNDRGLPVFQALHELERRWLHLSYSWGPTGSAGFELATGAASVTETSDLDLVLRIDAPCSIVELKEIAEIMAGLPCAVDLQVETPFGAFALSEYLECPEKLLLRTSTGPMLVRDPWRSFDVQELCA